jgi:WD40 repeat protein
LLVVGGKGARLLGSAANAENFTKLTASFRPATAIATLDFSFDPASQSSNRLVAGDSEGNIRVWELMGREWSESSGAAAHLTGHHRAPIVATCFDPIHPERMLTVDKTAKLSIWKFDEQWTAEPLQEMQVNGQAAHCALFSPNGNRIFMGTDNDAQIWHRSDRDHYEPSEPFQTGKVQTATFSGDGSWIVTSDGDKSVAFWDCNGQRFASLPENVSTLALSWDRRRLCTGHPDKRVVVWDTSKLVDPQLAVLADSGKIIKELLTLEEHRRAVTSIALSPNGRHLLSADEEGRTIISAGDPISPISLTLSRNRIVYARDSSATRVDAWAIVNDPSRLADFSNAEFTVTLTGNAIDGELITFVSSAESTGAMIETVNDGTVIYRPYRDAEPLPIGKLTSNIERVKHIVLNKAADACSVQALLRSLTYEIGSTAQDGEPINADRQKTVNIKLEKIQNRDALPGEKNETYSLQAEILIDVATKPDAAEEEVTSSGAAREAGATPTKD